MKAQKKYSIWIKWIWAIIFLISLTVASISCGFIMQGGRLGAFSDRPFVESGLANELARRGPDGFVNHDNWEVFEQSELMKQYVDMDNQTMLDLYQYYQSLDAPGNTVTRSQTPEYYESLYQDTNLRGRVIARDLQQGTDRVLCSLGGTWDENTILVDRVRDVQLKRMVFFEIGFDKNLSNSQDPLGQTMRLDNRLSNNKGELWVILIGSALLCGLSVLVLLLAAGHRPTDSEIHLRALDRWALAIPLTILISVWAVVYIWTMDELYAYTHIVWHPEKGCMMLAICFWVTGFLGFLGLRTVTVRIKAHRFWNTTLCYYILCAPVLRFIRKHRAERRAAGQVTQPLLPDAASDETAKDIQEAVWKKIGQDKSFWGKAKGSIVWIWRGIRNFFKHLRQGISKLNVMELGMLCGALVAAGYLAIPKLFWNDEAVLVTGIFSVFVLFGLFFVLKQISSLQAGAEKLSAGKLTHKVDTSHLHGPFRTHAENLNNISAGMMVEVERRMKSEHLKTELLTNVSHDIKTPLTSIINYVDLIKKLDVQPEEAKEYAEVLERQSHRLKKLLEDLIEASKAATGNITAELAPTDAAELLRQAEGEYNERLTEQQLTPVLRIDTDNCVILADGRLLWRVFDNLLGNIVKYAMPGTRVYLELAQRDSHCVITIRNISKNELGIEAEELMERFVRGDAARATEGSGLGLSIARSLTECMKGGFHLVLDGDLFKVILDFPLV